MYRVLLVEDEHLIREGFKRTIDWDMYGFEIVAEAQDGAGGLMLAERHCPHLIFADVRMPGMDGLEFAQLVLERLPDTKIVIVSGYKDYEYFRQSLQLGLFDYLLKPVDDDELIRVVENAARQIDGDQLNKRKAIEDHSRIRKSDNLLHTALLNKLTEGDRSPLSGSIRDPYLQSVANDEYVVAVVRIDNYHLLAHDVYSGDEEALLYTAFNICEESVDAGTIVFRQLSLKKQITLLRGYSLANKDSELEEFHRQCAVLIDNFNQFGRFGISLGIGRSHESWPGIHSSYSEACKAVERTKFNDDNQLVMYEGSLERDGSIPLLSPEFEKVFKSACKQQDREKCVAFLNALFQSPEAVLATRGQIYETAARIGMLADQAIRDSASDIGEDTPFVTNKSVTKTFDNLEEIRQWLVAELDDLFNKRSRVYRDSKALIHGLKNYVTRHFTSEEITLSQLSSKFGMNIYQICRMFKSEFKVNFHAYLTDLKMEKAKNYLLNSTMPVQDIAYLVGFKETKYFFKVFKKHVGLTPTEYRNQR
jgi:two-component system response regulator YesN